jgi:ribosomal protein S10
MIDKELCGELVARCFQARTDAHIAHLSTKSYAAHKALNEFYDEIVDLADAFAESAQGRCGILPYPECEPHGKVDNPVATITAFRRWIDDERDDCTDHSELQNVVDEIVTLCNSTLYKLKVLS